LFSELAGRSLDRARQQSDRCEKRGANRSALARSCISLLGPKIDAHTSWDLLLKINPAATSQ
jgi:hypothetical protein